MQVSILKEATSMVRRLLGEKMAKSLVAEMEEEQQHETADRITGRKIKKGDAKS